MISKKSCTSALFATLYAIVFSGQSCAAGQNIIKEPLRFSPATVNQSYAKSNIVLATWLPGKNHLSHSLACTEEEVNEMGCETLYKHGVAYWCSCPREQGENEEKSNQ